MDDSWGLGFHSVFPFDRVYFLRRQTYEALLIRPPPIALRTSPEAKTPSLPIDFSEIHGRPIVGTAHPRNRVQLISVSVLAQHEVSTRHAVVDETIGHRTRIGRGRRGLTLDHQGNLSPPHVYVMFVAEWVKFLTRLHTRHMASTEFDTPSDRVTEGMGFVFNRSGITFSAMAVKQYSPSILRGQREE
ncbi:MAG: hypothetical protein DMG49_27700 [Acidobacteria bacterium]|nr:MAG: hypothetical protein DMG49_27700 [Acidobacteriota bacterium]